MRERHSYAVMRTSRISVLNERIIANALIDESNRSS
jgi:hypothetical protein